MTVIPQDAPRSEDGQWWWDGAQWQPVGDAGQGQQQGGQAGGGGGGDAGAAEFGFDNNGLIVQVDQSDNPDNHVTLHTDAGTEAVFTVCNMGTAAGAATVTIYVDDQQVQTWTSGSVAAGQCEGANVSGCGRYGAGSHRFRAVVTPGHSGNDDTTNTVDIDDN
ncbi:MAG: hypothetical protein WCB51_04785 [Candidatus Dormiibacterota bacterium]